MLKIDVCATQLSGREIRQNTEANDITDGGIIATHACAFIYKDVSGGRDFQLKYP